MTKQTSWQNEIDRGIELLEQCYALQSEKDGIQRPNLNCHDRTKTLDSFALDIQAAIRNMTFLHKFFPMMLDLANLGRQLEAEGKIEMLVGDEYGRVALDYILEQNNAVKKAN